VPTQFNLWYRWLLNTGGANGKNCERQSKTIQASQEGWKEVVKKAVKRRPAKKAAKRRPAKKAAKRSQPRQLPRRPPHGTRRLKEEGSEARPKAWQAMAKPVVADRSQPSQKRAPVPSGLPRRLQQRVLPQPQTPRPAPASQPEVTPAQPRSRTRRSRRLKKNCKNCESVLA